MYQLVKEEKNALECVNSNLLTQIEKYQAQIVREDSQNIERIRE